MHAIASVTVSLLIATVLAVTGPGALPGPVALPGPGAEPHLGQAPGSLPTQDAPFLVVTFNIHAGKDADGMDNLARVAEVIRAEGVGLVLLQEVDRRTERSGGVDQLQALVAATGLQGAFGKTLDYQGGAYGIALLSRWPIRRHALLPLPVDPPQERAGGSHEPRGVLHAVVDAPGGELHVLNTHLDPSGDDGYRWQEVRHLLSVADSLGDLGLTVLFGGDLNALPDTRIVDEARARGWRDAWEDCGSGTGFTYPAQDPARRIDYVFQGDGLACGEARVLPTTASDHRPLAVRLMREVASADARAQSVPGTDIWIFPLTASGPVVDPGGGIRVTQRPGYDNQPHFGPGGAYLLYTSIDGAGQADIYRYDLSGGSTENLTRTAPESEYSATVMPDGERFSVIRVEADSTQRLWSFDLSGSDPRVILPDIAPVGYHAWIDEQSLALFVLGSPPTLQIVDLGTQTGQIRAQDIGRSLHKVPRHPLASFLQWETRAGRRLGVITTIDPASGKTAVSATALEGGEDYAWTPQGILLMGSGSRLFRNDPRTNLGWEEIADLAPLGVGGISRLAVSPDGRWIAVVGEEG